MSFHKLHLALAALALSLTASAEKLTDWVNPFIGTTNFSVCNPGAVRPHGMMTVTPFNVMGSDLNAYDKDSRWWSSPYEWTNSYLTGFAHGVLSGVGCPDMGTLLTMPTTGPIDVDYRHYGSTYHDQQARPGYYAVSLDKYDVRCELTATTRASIERYTFPKGEGHVLLNLGDALTNETGAMVRRVSDTEVEGFRLLGNFCFCSQAVFPIYFVMRLSKQPDKCGYWKKMPNLPAPKGEWNPDNDKLKLYTKYTRPMAGERIGWWTTFTCEEGEQVEVRMGISFVSMANARENLERELAGKTFDDVRRAADDEWERTLSVAEVEGGTAEQRRMFYTALYHTQISPSILQDSNGDYPMMESGDTGNTHGADRYTVFSLWDTYRNLHQLETLLYPDRQEGMVRTMIDMYREWGWMPKWELYGRETWTMEGDPAICVITDSWLKGLRGFDINTAYEAFRKSATTPGTHNLMRPDIDPYIQRGYIPVGYYAQDSSGDNSVSHSLEYYVADAALARLADALGHKADATLFRRRSLQYRTYYSPTDSMFRPRLQDGSWITPFNPRDGENFSNTPGFHEGSAWNYAFYVPHDILGLARLMGGKNHFVNKLQRVFDNGYYDPANEPDIAYAYLFSRFPGEEWRTQREVSRLLRKYYSDRPDGIPGNDDTGTMSAWAAFSMMGFYPDCPGEPSYTLTTPVFSRVTLHLDPKYYPNGDLVIEKVGGGSQANGQWQRIKSMTLGGKPLKAFRVSHADLMRGGKLVFTVE